MHGTDSPYRGALGFADTRPIALEFATMTTMKEYLTCTQAALLLNLSPRTLEKFRVNGGGPAFHKFGSRVRYLRTDLNHWADSRSCVSTSDANYRRVGAGEVLLDEPRRRSRRSR